MFDKESGASSREGLMVEPHLLAVAVAILMLLPGPNVALIIANSSLTDGVRPA